LLKKLPEMKIECCEKKIIVEAVSLEQAKSLCSIGADGIQFDKLTIEDLHKAADYLKSRFPNVVILAAGGINETNISDYAKTNIDGIVTTSLYSAKPIDIGVKIE
jgi:molybdenum transport protein